MSDQLDAKICFHLEKKSFTTKRSNYIPLSFSKLVWIGGHWLMALALMNPR